MQQVTGCVFFFFSVTDKLLEHRFFGSKWFFLPLYIHSPWATKNRLRHTSHMWPERCRSKHRRVVVHLAGDAGHDS